MAASVTKARHEARVSIRFSVYTVQLDGPFDQTDANWHGVPVLASDHRLGAENDAA